MKKVILSSDRVTRTVTRMAYEIYENNYGEDHLVIAGVYHQGYQLSKLLKEKLEEISDLSVSLVGVKIDKREPHTSDVVLEVSERNLDGKVLILVDDVLNSGRTFTYCLRTLLQYNFSKVETAVLVNRSHKKFPISAKYKGFDLSTTISEYVEVQLDDPVSVLLY